MTGRHPRWFWVFIVAAAAVMTADAVFSAVVYTVWPVHVPAWTQRAFSVAWLAGILLAAAAAVNFGWRKWRQR